jgi:hypothetical protein
LGPYKYSITSLSLGLAGWLLLTHLTKVILQCTQSLSRFSVARLAAAARGMGEWNGMARDVGSGFAQDGAQQPPDGEDEAFLSSLAPLSLHLLCLSAPADGWIHTLGIGDPVLNLRPAYSIPGVPDCTRYERRNVCCLGDGADKLEPVRSATQNTQPTTDHRPPLSQPRQADPHRHNAIINHQVHCLWPWFGNRTGPRSLALSPPDAVCLCDV